MTEKIIPRTPKQIQEAKDRIIGWLVTRGYNRDLLNRVFNCKCYTASDKWCSACESFLKYGNKYNVYKKGF